MARLLSPGEKLFNWILDRYKKLKVNEDSWITVMSREFDIDELEKYLMRSTVLMLLRKLIWNALFYIDTFVDMNQSRIEFEKDYLLRCLGFRLEQRRELVKLIFDSVVETRESISSGLFNRLKREARANGSKCEICGCTINYEVADDHSSFSLDHIWSRSLGGCSEEWNLRVSCKRCNDKRQNLAEACDVHYEHFHVKSQPTTEKSDSFKKELEWRYRIAALFKADLKCEMCGVSITQMGEEPHFIPIRKEEAIDIFNIRTVCAKHIKVSFDR